MSRKRPSLRCRTTPPSSTADEGGKEGALAEERQELDDGVRDMSFSDEELFEGVLSDGLVVEGELSDGLELGMGEMRLSDGSEDVADRRRW